MKNGRREHRSLFAVLTAAAPISALEILIFSAIALAYFWVFRFYESHTLWSTATYVALVAIVIVSFRLHRIGSRQSGFRLDNLAPALVQLWPPTAALVVLVVIIATWKNYPRRLPDAATTAALLGWSVIQQMGLQSFLLLRARAVAGPAGGVVLAASVFALLHSPNWPLVAASFVGGWIWCRSFLRHPNIPAVALSHFVLSLALVTFVKDPWLNGLHVGPRRHRYDAYGQGVIVAAGRILPGGSPQIAAARGPHSGNDSTVRLFDSSGNMLREYQAFDDGISHGVNLAVARGAETPGGVIVAAPGPGRSNPPLIRLLDAEGRLLRQFYAFDRGGYGATVATADLDVDGRDEILVGRGPGPGLDSMVRVFDLSGNLRREFQGLPAAIPNGVRVSAGDIDGDGVPEILCAPSYLSTNPATVFVRDGNGRELFHWTPVAGLMFGLNPAALRPCQVEPCLLIAPGAGWWLPASLQLVDRSGKEALYEEPFGRQARYGLNLASADLDGDGNAEIIAGEGAAPQGGSRIAVYDVQSRRVVKVFRAF